MTKLTDIFSIWWVKIWTPAWIKIFYFSCCTTYGLIFRTNCIVC